SRRVGVGCGCHRGTQCPVAAAPDQNMHSSTRAGLVRNLQSAPPVRFCRIISRNILLVSGCERSVKTAPRGRLLIRGAGSSTAAPAEGGKVVSRGGLSSIR